MTRNQEPRTEEPRTKEKKQREQRTKKIPKKSQELPNLKNP
jgi:hypothetical protein